MTPKSRVPAYKTPSLPLQSHQLPSNSTTNKAIMSPSKVLVFLGFVALAHGCAEEFQQCAEGLEGRIMQYMAGATSFSDIEV